jgi:hypothetical protein
MPGGRARRTVCAMRNPLHLACRALAPLALVATGLLLTTGPADAAGVPPTVGFTFSCSANGPLASFGVTNNDLGAHDVAATLLPGGPTTPFPLPAGVPAIGGAMPAADGQLVGWEITEDGIVLANSGLRLADSSAPGCWTEPQDQAPAEPQAPTITVDVDCDGANEIEVTAFSDDPFAHDLVATITIVGFGTFDVPIALGPDESGVTATQLVGDDMVRIVVTEAGTVLHDTGFFIVDASAGNCTMPVTPQAPSVTFGSHCDDGGVTIDVDYVNNDLLEHDLVVLLTTLGVGTQEIGAPTIPLGEQFFTTDHFVPFGAVVQLVVEESGTVLGQSPLWETTPLEDDCTKLPNLVPIEGVPSDTPPTTTTVPETTSTTSAPETTTTTQAAPVPEPLAEPVVVSEDVKVPAPAPQVTFRSFAAPAPQALPRTGFDVKRLVLVAWVLIGAGVLVRRAAVARRA